MHIYKRLFYYSNLLANANFASYEKQSTIHKDHSFSKCP